MLINKRGIFFLTCKVLAPKTFLILFFCVFVISSFGQGPKTLAIDSASPAKNDPSAEMYLNKCSGCHSVGGGKMTGPDLEKAITWPDEDLAKNIKKMEKNVGPLADKEIAALVKLLKDSAIKERFSAAQKAIMLQMMAKLDPASEEMGRNIFNGKMALQNGGISCASCHNLDGEDEKLGPNLSQVFVKLGELGLISAVENANFKIMNAAYRDNKVTKQEALHLTKYLEKASKIKNTHDSKKGLLISIMGCFLAIISIGIILITYKNRSNNVRANLVRKASRRKST